MNKEKSHINSVGPGEETTKLEILEMINAFNNMGWRWVGGKYETCNSVLTLACMRCGSIKKELWRNRAYKLTYCAGCTKDRLDANRGTYFAEQIKSIGIEALTEYKDAKSNIKVKCIAKGHIYATTWDNLMSVGGCRYCKYETLVYNRVDVVKIKERLAPLLQPFECSGRTRCEFRNYRPMQ